MDILYFLVNTYSVVGVIAQMCELCNYSKCEHVHDNRTQLWKSILNFKLMYNDKKNSKLSFSKSSRSKIYKITSINLYHLGLSNNNKYMPQPP